ncbi:hypothetical protein [Pseudolysinimonas sp.]|jgi:hypothetical protein|uniref:PD-(D/E)XK nuclease domain-containing protein n=1 Tax=Pseudolysinimonas sp. TaxID=2680009 RepID=UPI0037838FE6
MAYVGATSRVPRELVGAFTGWVNNSGGPTHTQLDKAILNAGLDVPDGAPNKVAKIRQVFDHASPEDGRRLVEELIHTLRDTGFWGHNAYDRNVAVTRAALARIGGTVSDEGFLEWGYSPGEVIAASTPPDAPPVFTPRTTLTTPEPAPPVARSAGSTNVSHERLLWLLRRVPASFSALVSARRSGHDSLALADEYDLQDATEVALRLLYNDVRTEERTPSYAGSSTTQDFLLFEVKTMVEIKVTRRGRGNVRIREEIDIDSMAYLAHPNVDRMVFVVYDLAATITNPQGFEHDLSTPINGHARDALVVPWPYPVLAVSPGD